MTLFTSPEKKLPRAPRGLDAEAVELVPEEDAVVVGNMPKGSSGFAGSATLFTFAAAVVGENSMTFSPSFEVFNC